MVLFGFGCWQFVGDCIYCCGDYCGNVFGGWVDVVCLDQFWFVEYWCEEEWYQCGVVFVCQGRKDWIEFVVIVGVEVGG